MATSDQLHLQAIAQAQQGNILAAIQKWQRALQQDPQHLLSWQNIAIAHYKIRDYTNAAQSNQKALQLTADPELQANLQLNLGAALAKLKEFDGAISAYQNALKLKPNWSAAQRNLGNVLTRSGELIQAETLLRDVLDQTPDDAENHHGLANVLWEQARYEDALVCYEQAIALNPNFADARTNLGLIKMLLGDWTNGTALYESRLQCSDIARLLPHLPFPLWHGESLQGKTILLHGDLGLGDSLQFMRYAPLLEQAGATVILHVPKSLVAIAQTLPGTAQILSQSAAVNWSTHSPTIDYWCPLLSLPHRCCTTPDTIPTDIPYLKAPGDHPPLPPPIKPNSSTKLGIVWASGGLSETRRQRSTQLSQWQPIAALPNVQLYSLQKERSPQEQEQLQTWKIIDLADQLTDFVATAHYITQLDAVLTVDTAVAHLAGALGKTVYVLLPHVPDWRWQLSGSATPWYPTMTLIRQPALNRWEPAIAQLARTVGCQSPSP